MLAFLFKRLFKSRRYDHVDYSWLPALIGIGTFALSYPLAFGFTSGDLIIALLFIFTLFKGRMKILTEEKFQYLIALVLSISFAVSSLAADNLYVESLYQPIRYLIVLILPLFVLVSLSDRVLLGIIFYMYVGAVATAFVGVLVYTNYYDLGVEIKWISAQRLSLWDNPNGLGAKFAMATLIGLALKTYKIIYLPHFLHYFALIILVAAIFFTMSFGSLISLIVGISVFILFVFMDNKQSIYTRFFLIYLLFLGAILLITFLTNAHLLEVLPSRFQTRIIPYLEILKSGEASLWQSLDKGSLDTRIDYLATALELLREKPILGYGAGVRYEHGIYPHTWIILMWLEGGIIALMMSFTLLLLWLYIILRGFREYTIFSMGISLLITYVVISLQNAHMYQIHIYTPLLTIVTIALKKRRTGYSLSAHKVYPGQKVRLDTEVK